jgi:hypothetical protein
MRWTARAAALVLAGGIAVGGAAPAAVAHGGDIDVEVGTDGAGGISAALTWAGDGHPVEESAVVVVRAVSAAGEEVGPVTLVSASEGVGWYRSDAELLDEGSWTVTARVTEPEKAKVETRVDVVAPPVVEAPAASPGSDDAPADDAATDDTAAENTAAGAADETDVAAEPGAGASAQESADRSPAGWTMWVGAAVVVAVAALVTLLLRRRRT